MTRPPAKPKRSRADLPANRFDFNPLKYERAAEQVTPARLEALFEGLDRADELFDANQRDGTLAAIRSVVEFLVASPANANGRFSRPFELLFTELRGRSKGVRTRILPQPGSGSGGVLGRGSDHYVKAAAALAVERLHKLGGMTVDAAAAEVVCVLVPRGFVFGMRRDSKLGGVKAWRRDRARAGSAVAAAYRKLSADTAPPSGDNAEAVRASVLAWFTNIAARAGYGATA